MKKKLMILVVATLFITMMFSTGCKKKFDINGLWLMTMNYTTPWAQTYSGTITCTGDKSSGTISFDIADWGVNIGSYTVDGKNVILSINWPNGNTSTYSGSSIDDNNMSGTISETSGSTGTWTATR